MGLDIKVIKKKNFVYCVELTGSLDTETYQQLEEELKEIIDEKTKMVILDMAGVDYISSAGVGVVIWARKTLKKYNASFSMVNLQPQIQKVLDALKILPMIDIFENMPEADKSRKEKQFYSDRPQETPGFFLKGAGSYDWGMKNRLARVFNPASGRTVMLAGFRTSASIILEQLFDEVGVDYKVATDDGSRGFKGLVTALFDQELDGNVDKNVAVYSCGPEPMLKRVAEITAERGLPCELSLEQRMACGVGACLVCACSTKTPDGGTTYKMVCKDGPIFDPRDVVLE